MERSLLYPQNNEARRAVSLNGMWEFRLDWNQEGADKHWENGLSGAEKIPVPSSFNDLSADPKVRDYCGDFWYETSIFIPEEWKGRRVEVRFGSAAQKAAVFLNGKEICRHEGGYLPFNADITEAADYGEYNRLSVRLNNELTETILPAGGTEVLSDGRKIAKPNFDFFPYAGLQRNVFLTARPQEGIEDYEVDFELNGTPEKDAGGDLICDASVRYHVDAPENADIRVSLLDKDGTIAASSQGATGTLRIENAHLWHVRRAYLYTIEIRCNTVGKTDIYRDHIGIRTVQVHDRTIQINGIPVYLKGFGRHEDSDIAGKGFNPPVLTRDFALMRWVGANSFRTSHYPYAEEVYQMADEEGFLVIDETTGVGCLSNLMGLGADHSGKPFFRKETIPALLKHHIGVIDDMIKRDKNHPCVIMWSLLNEPDSNDEAARPYFERIFGEALSRDPQKRPRTYAVFASCRPETDQCHDLADVIALNRYYGWYAMGGPDIGEAEKSFDKEMDEWEKVEPEKPVIFTEYGADTNAELEKLPSVMWSVSYQIDVLKMCHRVFDRHSSVQGEQIWNFADFQTTQGVIRMNGNKKGIFTRQREPKPAAFYLRERWESR